MNFSSGTKKISFCQGGTTAIVHDARDANLDRTPTASLSRYSGDVSDEKNAARRPGVGLCANCRFMRRIQSDRGSTFYLCERSATDANFPKYPRLPVLQCAGYEPLNADLSSQ